MDVAEREISMNSIKQQARFAGVLYIVLAITGIYSIMYVPGQIVEFGDASATAANLLESEQLYRFGLFVGIVSNIVFLFVGLALYRLFRDVDKRLAALMVILVILGMGTGFVNTFNLLGALIVLSGAEFLSVFSQEQLEALAYFLIRLQSHGTMIVQVFWGLWLFPFGMLVIRSGFIPKIFGYLLYIGGTGYILSCAAFLLMSDRPDWVSPLTTILEVGELPVIFWLAIMGAREPMPVGNAAT